MTKEMWKLGSLDETGCFIDIHLINENDGHYKVITMVWKMEEDERSPSLEKLVHDVVNALNQAQVGKDYK